MILDKSLALYERNENGELIPQLRKLKLSKKDLEDYPELKNVEVSIIPLSRGEIQDLFSMAEKGADSKADNDAELVIKNCVNPRFSREEIPSLKPVIVRSIVSTILDESGVKIDENSGVRKIDSESDEFGKN